MAVKSFKDVKENLKAYPSMLKSKINSYKGQGKLEIKKAQNIHQKKYGHEMSPSKLKSSMDGIVLDKESKDYLNTKKQVRKQIKSSNYTME